MAILVTGGTCEISLKMRKKNNNLNLNCSRHRAHPLLPRDEGGHLRGAAILTGQPIPEHPGLTGIHAAVLPHNIQVKMLLFNSNFVWDTKVCLTIQGPEDGAPVHEEPHHQ